MKNISVSSLKDFFSLQILAGDKGLSTIISSEDVHRPGLELTGFYENFPNERIQVFGKQEMTYLETLDSSTLKQRMKEYIQLKPLCIIVTRNLQVHDCFIELCDENNISLLRTHDKTTNFISELNNFLEKELALETGIHGVCVNVYGVGILIRGKSGIGKSEVALSLIEKGHRLIADDLVVLKKIGPVALIGTHNGLNKEFLSLRGIGLVNVLRLYGSGASQNETKINLDIELSPWEDGKYYDAVGMDETTVNYLGIDVPNIILPIRPGRDIATLIEVAAKNWRLRSQGYSSFEDFDSRLKGKE